MTAAGADEAPDAARRSSCARIRPTMPRGALVLATLAVLALLAWRSSAAQGGAAGPDPAAPRWFKGNTHTHTLNSDGDSTPDEVVRWYREHGYNFLVLSDHNYLTSVDGLNALHGADGKFLVVPGEEVTSVFEPAGAKRRVPIHVNGLNIRRSVGAQTGATVVEILQKSVDAIRGASGVPHINHPNFEWALTADDLRKIERQRLFEVYNGHPLVNNEGGGGSPGLEEMWDDLLTSGRLIYGIAVDDAHQFKEPWNPAAARPGRGWVMVRAPRLAADAILEALERGDFYASTGVHLEDYRVDAASMTVSIAVQRSSRYRVRFIGKGGRLLQESTSTPARYAFRGDEGYVRARILESNGASAWTQPVVLDR